MHDAHIRAFLECEPFLTEEARRAALKAISYRGFDVGCAVQAYSAEWGDFDRGIVCATGRDEEPTVLPVTVIPIDLPGRRPREFDSRCYRIYVGSNLKFEQGGLKICAELQAIGAARTAGAQLITGLVVAGQPQHDDVSDWEPPTLHPCYNCRYFLERLPEIDEDTMVVTVCNHAGPTERHTVSELLAKHHYHQSRKEGRSR